MGKVQHEKNINSEKIMKREKSPIREKYNMERVQHEESATRKSATRKGSAKQRKCNMKIVQHVKSAI